MCKLMGRLSRLKPANLHKKLRQVRLSLRLSQTEMLIHLGYSANKKSLGVLFQLMNLENEGQC